MRRDVDSFLFLRFVVNVESGLICVHLNAEWYVYVIVNFDCPQ